jgi:hypothetical protein
LQNRLSLHPYTVTYDRKKLLNHPDHRIGGIVAKLKASKTQIGHRPAPIICHARDFGEVIVRIALGSPFKEKVSLCQPSRNKMETGEVAGYSSLLFVYLNQELFREIFQIF